MSTSKLSLNDLEMRGDFIHRHIGSNQQQISEILAELNLEKLEDLIDEVLPNNILNHEPLKLTDTISETAVIKHLYKMGKRNKVFISLIGMGYYDTIMPAVIRRNVLENPSWYTAYTPYQAEVSQGRLEALLNFQQMVSDLTGMDLANASLLDEATAAAEAMTMSYRLSKNKSNLVFIDENCYPQTIAVMQTRAESLGFNVLIGNPYQQLDQYDFFSILVQYPASTGDINDLTTLVLCAHEKSALVTVATDLLSLVLIKSPADYDVDIVVGNSQRFGVPMGYGGPHAAFFATRDVFKRSIPGRIIGVSKDCHGQLALRMALQTREQHIRRDKATSNICTSQVLLAIIAGFYAIYHGPRDLYLISKRVHRYSQILAKGIEQLGYSILTQHFFDTFVIHTPSKARAIINKAQEKKINLRMIDYDHLAISVDETTDRDIIRTVWNIFSSPTDDQPVINMLDEQVVDCIPQNRLRHKPILQHPVFEKFHSETGMMRYLRRLARKDIALDRSMIPLGSCTMKLNAATEMMAISSANFNGLHPFAPLYQAMGYQQLFEELDDMLCDLTGFNAFSFQPNAGSQGEYTGLLVIRKYYQVAGESNRNICLIPASAHGTNPASAMMAGYKVVVLSCDDRGNISMKDLLRKVTKYSENLAVLMITYPSTHGVYEESFCEMCKIIHQHGGQVYLDGANFNALVGLSRPGNIGVDVAHFNLHKTFSIPHGGGGPGVGPIGVATHLLPYLPDHPIVKGINPYKNAHGTIGTVAAAPWGSASILTISWAYIAMMGAVGLRKATLTAILNANYIAKCLKPFYPILYTGNSGWVAHECIIDCRAFKNSCNITVEDIAKRLIDFGFHAPTISFPVLQTLMIEPTESESKEEIDRFCQALICIRQEIKDIEMGSVDRVNNVLHNAPHSFYLLLTDWHYPYTQQQAFFPAAHHYEDKYWPPVGRINNEYGDRNLQCSCPTFTDY